MAPAITFTFHRISGYRVRYRLRDVKGRLAPDGTPAWVNKREIQLEEALQEPGAFVLAGVGAGVLSSPFVCNHCFAWTTNSSGVSFAISP